MKDLRLAWRNLGRNRARTLISATAITLSFAALLVTFGLSDATYRQVLVAAVRTAGGNVLVHADGWNQRRSGDLLVAEPQRVEDAARALPGVRATVARMVISGLLGSPRGAEPIELVGTRPADQALLVDLTPFLATGTFLATGEAHPLVIGTELAQKLGVGLGDRVVLTATDPHGELTRALFRVSGILRARTGLPDGTAFTTPEAAAAAVGAGRARTEVALLLDDDDARATVAIRLGRALAGGQPLEVLPWDRAFPELVGAIRADKAFAWLFGLVVFVVMGFGIANTFLMAVLERVRELGLLAALGMTPARTARLVFTESALLSTIAVAAGYALALAAHLYLSRRGIDLAALSGMKVDFAGVMVADLQLRSAIDPWRWLVGGAGVVVIVVLSACYPAWRAARLDPVAAMRTYE